MGYRLTREIEVNGVGVHSGTSALLRFLPANTGSGVRFRRVDLPGAPEIKADLEHLAGEDMLRRTVLRTPGAEVYTIEHIMSALQALEVFDAVVELNAPEPPFLDGSAAPYAELLATAIEPSSDACVAPLRITRPTAFTCGDAEFAAIPSEAFRVTFFFASPSKLLENGAATYDVTPDLFRSEIAPARTFCFFHEIEELRRRGLIRGGNLSCSVVIGRKSIINSSLRYPDEPLRHKILDLIGDLALLGKPLRGHFLAWRSGHRSNAQFACHIRKEFGF